ncbi:hypothetical protein DB88DRAFT_501687 [Papiliotrema laurentii]|uniref:ER membrane protein complex subunit 7 beta-sandwich domain-containing protein n=1 Tax=Papiliotrema laurentii TaxID=5418 RepID=A0AAD9CUA1_PAPLA|nr:hypothetical protein DB88DRAFT_501687 [Papiliotrema laurentii]
MRLILCILSLIGLQLVSAAEIVGRVVLDGFPGQVVPIGSKVVLDHGSKTSLILADGSFVIHGVPDGEHLLQPIVPGYTLPTTLYTIAESSIHAQPYIPSRLPLPTSTPSMPLPIALVPHPEDYYTAPQGVNILAMLKNPMVLMMLFSGVMMYALPKLTASMDLDPDMAKDMAETRKKMQGMQNMDFMESLSSMLAGESADSPKGAKAGEKPTQGPAGNGKKRNKGR